MVFSWVFYWFQRGVSVIVGLGFLLLLLSYFWSLACVFDLFSACFCCTSCFGGCFSCFCIYFWVYVTLSLVATVSLAGGFRSGCWMGNLDGSFF